MDWKRVKSILIVLLAAANLVLGFSVLSQYRARDRQQRQALQSALAVAGPQSGLEEQHLADLPELLTSFQLQRDSAAESAFAQGLLGSVGFESDAAGGGIVRYSSSLGHGAVFNGGDMEFFIAGDWQDARADPAAALTRLLQGAGVEISAGAVTATAAGATCQQLWRGLSLEGYRLSCAFSEDSAYIAGRWLLGEPQEAGEIAPMPELVLWLGSQLERLEAPPIDRLSAGYQVSVAGVGSYISPIWIVEAGGQRLVFDLAERRPVS